MLISQTDLPTNVTTLYTYDKAGRKIKVTNTKQKVEYQFGKSYNSNTGLNNYGFRDYSSSIGRFITSDPIRDGTNWYTLAVNNPINFVDLWGLCTANDERKITTQVLISYTKNAYNKLSVTERKVNPDGTINYMLGVKITYFDATNIVRTPEERNNIPVEFNNYYYFPNQFPSGTWDVYPSASSTDKYIGPLKIATNAFTYVKTYTENNGVWEQTDVMQKDEGYMIHSGEGSTTWGCLKLSDEDTASLAEIIDTALSGGGTVKLLVL